MIKLTDIVDEIMSSEYATELRESCKKLFLLSEAKTGFTESVHEIFVALALAGCKNPQNFKKGGLESYTDSDIKSWVATGSSLLKDSQKHIDELITMRGTTEWSATAKDKQTDKAGNKVKVTRSLDLWIEASKISSLIKKLYLSGKYKMTGVSRVFGAGPGGRKIVADVVIYETGGTELSVSLKAGKHAQFTNLSIKNILNYLFPNTPDVTKGILNICYNDGFKKTLDQGYQAYLKFVLRNYYDHRDTVLGITDSDIAEHKIQQKNKKKDKKFKWNKKLPNLVYPGKPKKVTYDEAVLLDEIAFHKGGGYQGKNWVEKQVWSNGTNYMIGLSKELKKALEHAYAQKPLTSLKKTYESSKKHLVNKTIHSYLKEIDWAQVNLTGLFSYVLRAEPETSYLYAGASGTKLSFMPSESEIRNHTFTVKTESIDSADFVMLVKVFEGTNHLFTFDLKWRWGQGQWKGDLTHKGATFDVKPLFWTTFTGVPAGRWPGA